MNNFTAKQKEIVARKLGYDGPMQGFDEFLNSSPSLGMKYAALSDKFATRMAKGGMARKKYQAGGVVTNDYFTANPDVAAEYAKNPMGMTPSEYAQAHYTQFGKAENRAAPTTTTTTGGTTGTTTGGTTDTEGGTTTAPPTTPATTTTGTPVVPGATTYTAAKTATPTGATAVSAGPVEKATATTIAEGDVATVAAPKAITADVITADTSQGKVETALEDLTAQTGTVSKEAQATAVTQEPTTTAVAGLEAAQGTAAQVAPVADRTVQEGELISGSAVDMAKVEEELAKTEAAQGVVTEESTVQGQLNKLMQDFDANKPPPWAAASMRTATATLAARGLGASSLAGQAIIQAALESALPIASADAKVYEAMNLQNLTNRQAVALELGRQRATFLGQEFDQNFETRVRNAARIADIADKNFAADVQIAIENAQLTNTMNIANLSARNALVLEKAAAMSRLETQNLSNRQQVAVENAKAFLAMDIKNLDNRQQVAIFKAQEISDAIVSDTAAINAAKATNAANKLEADKINETLALTASQYNAAERNKVKLANMNASNEIAKFNAEQANRRAEFNANNATQINIANAKILAEVSVANTAAVNAANAVNAKNATELSASVYAQQSQTYRDLLSYSWKTGENDKERITNLAIASIQLDVAEIKADSEYSNAVGSFFTEAVKNIKLQDVKDGWNWLTGR